MPGKRSQRTLQVIPPGVLRRVRSEHARIVSTTEWKRFQTAGNSFINSSQKDLPFDPRFNAVHWGFDVNRLCKEIAYGNWWMNAYAGYYKSKVTPGMQPSHVDANVAYFADNCVTRIDSCRDKLALMVWAYYVPFNPENRNEVLDFSKVIERLRCPLKFGLSIKNQKDFLINLEKLRNSDFSRIEMYRHLKIHRREPRIEIYGVKPHHDWPYMLPLVEPKEIGLWRTALRKQYSTAGDRELRMLEEGCYRRGVLFDRRQLKDRLWAFDEIKLRIDNCLTQLLNASAGCFNILTRRPPLRSRRKANNWFRRNKRV